MVDKRQVRAGRPAGRRFGSVLSTRVSGTVAAAFGAAAEARGVAPATLLRELVEVAVVQAITGGNGSGDSVPGVG